MKVIKDRIEEIMTLIAEVANGNFDYGIEASETGDELDAIIAGISMLGQELKNSTVSRDFMHSIYEGVVDMLLILNNDLTIRSINEAFTELLGYREEDVTGLPFGELVQEQDRAKLQAYMYSFHEKGKYLNAELLLNSVLGQALSVSCSFSILKNNKNAADGILIIAKDITEIKKKEQELKEAKEKAEAASEAKSNFLSSMSHEIRTPLNGIMGFTDLLMGEELNQNQAQYVRLLKTSGSTLAKLLNDIMDLHRIEQDKISFEQIPFNIRESFSLNLEPYRHHAQSKNLSFSYSFAEFVPSLLMGDPTRIGQILINLVSNAIKFTETGGVQLFISTDDIAGEEDSIMLKCSIVDTGIGIPVEKQGFIFDSFTQSDQSTSRRYGGFGLGLAISTKLTALMQGKLGVISPPQDKEQGSCFWFTVKVKRVFTEEKSAAPMYSNAEFRLPADTQILVVDDNEINVLLMQTVLENMGAVVTTASTGEDGVHVARNKPFDLVFMDIQMPGMDGLEATTKLRNLKYSGPVIAFSANAYKDDIHKSLSAGMNDHLCKPLDQDELITLLNRWI